MKDVEHIGDIIGKVMETYRRRPESELTRIWDLWGAAVGEVVAGNAQPEAFKGKLLLVNVTSSTWIHHMQFVKKDIIDKINHAFGKTVVDDIKFKIGSI
jgi:predicted nucleic acid-binding Zn ribbon protein